ncbi:portal protein [Citrobacter sp. OP27]
MNKRELLSVMLKQKNAAEEIHGVISERYTLSYETYRGEYPPKINDNDIAASRVMWESFESIYPSLVELFTNSQKAPVSFDSDRVTNGKLAEAVSRAIHGAVLKIDGYYRLMMEALKEILITGNQAARVGYEEKTYETPEVAFEDAPWAEVAAYGDALIKSGYSIHHDLEFDDENHTATGSMYGERKIKFPVINLINFRNFYLHPKAVDVATSPYTGYSEDLTIAEAVEMGLPESKLKNASKDTFSNSAGQSKQLVVVNNMDGNIDAPDAEYDDYNQTITLFHHYWRGCYKGKKVKLWYVISTDTEILSIEAVKYCPLVLGGMSVVQGSGWSESLYDMTVTAQVNKTRAMRAIQASADGAAYGEYVYQESNMEPDGLATFLNDRGPGAAYNVRTQGAISKLGGNDVPQAMNLLNQEINEDAQATIQGSAGQAQALEENSNASGTAIQLTQNKQELNENQIASTIAETFLKPIYRLMLFVMQEIGESMVFDDVRMPYKALHADMGLSISIESPYDRVRAAANVKQAYEQSAQLGTLPKNFQPENVYNIYANYYRAITGQEDVSSLITPPDQMPQPSPLEQTITKFITVNKLRMEIAATGLAEAKVKDMQADVTKKLNDSLLDLAKIAEIKTNTRISMVETMLKAKELEQGAANEVTQKAQQQERIDQQQG